MTKKVKAALLVSLLLNILLIGWIAGNMIYYVRGHHGFHREEQAVLQSLPEEKRALFLETMKGARSGSRDFRDRMHEIRDRTLAILTAPVFDEQAYRAEVEELHRFRAEKMNRLAAATGKLAGQFNQEERKILAELLKRRPTPPSKREGP